MPRMGIKPPKPTSYQPNLGETNFMAYALQLRTELDRLAAQMRTITALAEQRNDNKGLTAEELTKWNALRIDYERIETSIKAFETNDDIEGRLRRVDNAAGNGPARIADVDIEAVQDTFRLSKAEKRRRDNEKDPHAKAFANYLRNGETSDASIRQSLAKFTSGMGLDAQNAQSTGFITTGGTGGSQGGYLVPIGFSGMLEEAKKWFGGIEGTVDKFQTSSGNPFPWPTVNDTTNRGRIIGQNVQIVETDLVFNQVTFQAYIGSSDLILVPLALIDDSYFDMDALVARLLGIRLGRLYNYKCTVGTGTGEPTGIVTAAATAGNVFQLGAGNTASVSYSNLVTLEHSVDPAYRENDSSKWMFSDTMLKLLKLLVDNQNRPLWQPGLTASFQIGAAVVRGGKPKILEHEYVINQDMPIPATSAYSMLFGDMSTFKAREVAGGTTLLVLRERYADYLQVGYTAFQRFDSNLIDAGTHPIAVLQQSAS